MEIQAYAKINLSLDVTGRRPDGYHLVRMIMQSISLHDTLFLERSVRPGIRLQVEGNDSIPCGPENLVWRAAEAMISRCRIPDGVDIRLVKRIPSAAGLAGGSTDAAAGFRGLNELWRAGLSAEELCAMGLTLGADIPFCIRGGTMLSEGIGEVLTELPPLPDCRIVLAKPAFDVPTGGVYRALDALADYPHPDIDGQIRALAKGSLEETAAAMGNVLELVTVPAHPEIAALKEILSGTGAAGVMMSGSGPTVFGLYLREEDAQRTCRILKEKNGTADVFAAVPVRWEVIA